MRCAIYLRISMDPTGKEAGVDRQQAACIALAEKLGWDVAATFTDNDISAFSGKRRPGFEALLDAIKDGEVEALVCWHTDRLYRKLKDLVRLLDVASGMEIRTVQGGDIDLSNATGRMVATILGSVSTNESEHHAERRREANLQRAVAGAWCATGSRPFGYDNTGTPLEPEATMLRTAAKEILGGRSLRSIAKAWNEEGVTTVRGVPWTNLHLRRVLMNPRIAGLRVHQKKVVGPGSWEPILDEDIFHGLSAFLTDPSRKNGLAFERKYLGSGVYRCGICGHPLYASYPHGRDKPMAYVCRPTAHIGRAGAPLDEFVDVTMLAHLLGTDVGTGLRENDQVDVAALRTQRDALVASRNQLGTLFGKHVIDIVALENGTVELNAEIAAIEKQLADATRTSPVAALLADGEHPEVLADEETLIARWTAATPDIKGKVVSQFMDVVVMPAPRGVRTFDHDLIDIRWH